MGSTSILPTTMESEIEDLGLFLLVRVDVPGVSGVATWPRQSRDTEAFDLTSPAAERLGVRRRAMVCRLWSAMIVIIALRIGVEWHTRLLDSKKQSCGRVLFESGRLNRRIHFAPCLVYIITSRVA